ncbi:GntR family transcriptional regulator [Paenibacillus koleovorans]|uniref:GntR family transcriptional regulator n=1 Tax=Paenibacillus koleovorans TaxID=121608 RepID=UPI001FEC1BC5|nr:GntR family transcriptional regulator [Paenibacillus koleovorans]
MADSRALPKYLQLKREILGWLEAGRYVEGDRMPTEHELAERYGMSRQTVRQTFGELEQEGRIHRVQGKGTFVSGPKASLRLRVDAGGLKERQAWDDEPDAHQPQAGRPEEQQSQYGVLSELQLRDGGPRELSSAYREALSRAASADSPLSAASHRPAPVDVQTIGIVTTYISDYIFPHIVRGAEAALRSRGYRMVLTSTDNDKTKERESLEMLMREPLSGLILEPTRSAEGNPNSSLYLALDYKRIPYVMINERYAEMSCPVIKVNDEAGTYKATEHLIALGHRRIAGFFKTDDLQGMNRLKGFTGAHRDHGVPLLPEGVVQYTTATKDSWPEQAAAAMLGDAAAGPTAIVCYNDELAVRLLQTIRSAGLRVPEDLSIVGFDDASLATATEVKLTTLTHPKTDMGARAAEWIVALIEGRPLESREYVYEPELILRGSTSEPRG